MTNPFFQLLHGSAFDCLRRLPSNFVQTCVTSPPYFQQRHYDRDQEDPYGRIPLGREKDVGAYMSHLMGTFLELQRVLRDNGTLWLNLGDKFRNKQLLGIPWKIAFWLQEQGWLLRSEIIWDKLCPMPSSALDRPTVAHETVFLFSKGKSYFYDWESIAEPIVHPGQSRAFSRKLEDRNDVGRMYDPQGRELRNKRTVWGIAPSSFAGAHCAVMPEKLAEVCIKAGTSIKGACPECGSPIARNSDSLWQKSCSHDFEQSRPCIVLDPFSGSGTTGVVALREDRSYIGIDISQEYIEMSRERLSAIDPISIQEKK